MNAEVPNLYDMDPEILAAALAEWGQPPYRARQIYRQLYGSLAGDFEDMTDLPMALRRKLAGTFRVGHLETLRVQTGDRGLTRKALFRLPEGESIETVLMVYPPDRATVCVSTQAGCPMGCVFCATAQLGFLRDLTSGRMVEQVLWAARELRRMPEDPTLDAHGPLPGRLTNVVFMGMGEAFNNYANWWASVERLHDPEGFDFGARNFTVSTVGLVPGILKLSRERLQVNLAVSLHAADDELRGELMPVNRAYPVGALMEACRAYVDRTGRRLSFEVVLLQHRNDEPRHAEQLVACLTKGPMATAGGLFHVNLIPWNPVPGSPLARSHRSRVLAFQAILRARRIPCTVRVERGVDIDAACGQLAGSHRNGGP